MFCTSIAWKARRGLPDALARSSHLRGRPGSKKVLVRRGSVAPTLTDLGPTIVTLRRFGDGRTRLIVCNNCRLLGEVLQQMHLYRRILHALDDFLPRKFFYLVIVVRRRSTGRSVRLPLATALCSTGVGITILQSYVAIKTEDWNPTPCGIRGRFKIQVHADARRGLCPPHGRSANPRGGVNGGHNTGQ